MSCTIPPAGWSCARAAGHQGPCAAIPTSDHIGALVAKLTKLLAAATPGPWEVDNERNEDGEYGTCPDTSTGFDDFLIGASVNGKWATLLTTENSTHKEIDEDYDEDFSRAWDRIGEANAKLAAEAVNALPLLLAAITAASAAGGDE